MAMVHLETLESRQFLSASAVVNLPLVQNGVLNIKGTAADDRFVITRQNALVLSGVTSFNNSVTVIDKDGHASVVTTNIVVNGHSSKGEVLLLDSTLPAGPYLRIETSHGLIFMQSDGINVIKVDVGSGDDYVEISKNVGLRSTLIGANGNDTLAGGSKSDVISGGAGNDILFDAAGTGGDTLDTGPGQDIAIQNYRTGVVPNDKVLGTLGQDKSVLGTFDKLASAITVIEPVPHLKLKLGSPSLAVDVGS